MKWGYKGTETALNGLANWFYRNYDLKGSAEYQRKEVCKLVVRYGEENIPDYKKFGHLEVAALFVARKIQSNNKFNHFKGWVKEAIKQIK